MMCHESIAVSLSQDRTVVESKIFFQIINYAYDCNVNVLYMFGKADS